MKFVWPAHLMPRAALWVALAVMAGVGVGAAVTYWLTGSPSAEQAALKIRYYKNPMGTGHVSGKPMKDEMGMDYVAVYEEEVKGTLSSESDSIAVGPRVVQNIGVRTAVVEKGRVAGEISANGVLALDEARTAIVTTKVDGYLETLHVRAIGQMVKPDDPLFDFYSPDLSAAMEEYLAAQRYQDTLPAGANQTMHRNATHLAIAAQKRLEALGLNAAHIRKIQSEGAVPRVVTFYSTQSGVVIKKNAVQGSRVAAGTELFVLADLSELWVLADVWQTILCFAKSTCPRKICSEF